MPLYELIDDALRPFTRLRPGPDLYEHEAEHLARSDLEALTGEPPFPVARQPHIAGGALRHGVVTTAAAAPYQSRR